MGDLITKLVPILHVQDPDAERRFYEQLGLRTTYEGPEYPGFIAVGNDAVEFGLSRRPSADPAASGLTWQLGISDVDAAITACERSGLRFEVTVERPRGLDLPDCQGPVTERDGGTARRAGFAGLRRPASRSLSLCRAMPVALFCRAARGTSAMPRSGRSEALRQERASVAVRSLVAISSTVSRWPAATLITSSYASSLVRVSRRPFTP
jgi:hypothetical protein